MQIFFVIDELNNLGEKIDTVRRVFGDNFKFFIDTKVYAKVCSNSFILNNLAGVYENNEVTRIDEYVKSDKFALDEIMLIYASASVTFDTLMTIKKKIAYGYDTIFVRNKRNSITNFFKKVYTKMVEYMFGETDSLAGTKVQYMSAIYVGALKNTTFANHIYSVKNEAFVDLSAGEKNVAPKFKLFNYNIYNLIAFFSFIAIYCVLIANFKLRFFVHLLFVMLIILPVALAVFLICLNIFQIRYKKK